MLLSKNKSSIFNLLIYFLIFVMITLLYYTPITNIYLDDHHMLNDKVWFNNEYEWLKYLLFYNQTRITNAGDYMLIRPVLFLINWILDLFFRDLRIYHYNFSLLMTFSSALSLYIISKKYFSPLKCLIVVFFFLSIGKSTVFISSHISPYILGLGMFSFGFYLLIHNETKQQKITSIISYVLLILSSLCHELFGISSIAITITIFILSNKLLNKTSFYIDRPYLYKTISLVSITWLLFYTLSLYLLAPPNIFSNGEVENILNYSFNGKIGHLISIFRSSFLLLVSILITSAFIIKIFKNKNSNFNKEDFLTVIIFYLPIIALFIGLFFGRLLTRGGYSHWYDVILLYFCLILLGPFVKFLFNQIYFNRFKLHLSNLIFSFLLIISLYHSATMIFNKNLKLKDKINDNYVSSFLEKTVPFFKNNSDKCFAGIVPNNQIQSNTISNTEYYIKTLKVIALKTKLETMLYHYNCHKLSRSTPIYLNLSLESNSKNLNIKMLPNLIKKMLNPEYITLTKSLPPNEINFHLLRSEKMTAGNIHHKKPQNNIIYNRKEKICLQAKVNKTKSIKLTFLSSDIFPRSLNTSIYIKTSNIGGYLTSLRTNQSDVSLIKKGGFSSEEYKKLNSALTLMQATEWSNYKYSSSTKETKSYLTIMPKKFNLHFIKNNDNFQIFFEKQIIGQISTQSQDDYFELYICPFKNNTKTEKLLSVKQ